MLELVFDQRDVAVGSHPAIGVNQRVRHVGSVGEQPAIRVVVFRRIDPNHRLPQPVPLAWHAGERACGEQYQLVEQKAHGALDKST